MCECVYYTHIHTLWSIWMLIPNVKQRQSKEKRGKQILNHQSYTQTHEQTRPHAQKINKKTEPHTSHPHPPSLQEVHWKDVSLHTTLPRISLIPNSNNANKNVNTSATHPLGALLWLLFVFACGCFCFVYVCCCCCLCLSFCMFGVVLVLVFVYVCCCSCLCLFLSVSRCSCLR